MSTAKFALQDSQYADPYHHFVTFDQADPRPYKSLGWGLEYYGYVSRVLELAAEQEYARAAEVGCGDGKVLYELSRRLPDATYEGYDLSEKAVAFAKAYALGSTQLAFHCRDFSEAVGQYDVVLCIETLEHIPDSEIPGFLETIASKMRPDGRLILSIPSINLPVSPKHYRHYSLEVLRGQVGDHFSIDHSEYIHARSSLFIRALSTLLVNRWFLLNARPLRTRLYQFYTRRYRRASAQTGSHLIAVLTKKSR